MAIVLITNTTKTMTMRWRRLIGLSEARSSWTGEFECFLIPETFLEHQPVSRPEEIVLGALVRPRLVCLCPDNGLSGATQVIMFPCQASMFSNIQKRNPIGQSLWNMSTELKSTKQVCLPFRED